MTTYRVQTVNKILIVIHLASRGCTPESRMDFYFEFMNEINEPAENYKSGWLKVYRSVQKHWIWTKNKPLSQFEAWITILFEVNHISEKFNIGYSVFECQRGEKYYSLETWAKLFNWDKSKVRRFFILLQKENMIELESVQKTTRLKVCNYDTYQSLRNDNETQVKRKRNASETQVTPIEELKNIRTKELKNINTWRSDFEIFKSELFNAFNEIKKDKEWILKQERFNPNVDILLSVEKSINNFWGTEAGWKNKKQSKSVDIDWKATFANNIDKNKVYKTYKNEQEPQPLTYRPNNNGNIR